MRSRRPITLSECTVIALKGKPHRVHLFLHLQCLIRACLFLLKQEETVSLYFKTNWFKSRSIIRIQQYHWRVITRHLKKVSLTKHHLCITKNVFTQNNLHHLCSKEKGLTKKTMVGGGLLFSRLNGLLEKQAVCRLAHLWDRSPPPQTLKYFK